jgi:hypothetical protein
MEHDTMTKAKKENLFWRLCGNEKHNQLNKKKLEYLNAAVKSTTE